MVQITPSDINQYATLISSNFLNSLSNFEALVGKNLYRSENLTRISQLLDCYTTSTISNEESVILNESSQFFQLSLLLIRIFYLLRRLKIRILLKFFFEDVCLYDDEENKIMENKDAALALCGKKASRQVSELLESILSGKCEDSGKILLDFLNKTCLHLRKTEREKFRELFKEDESNLLKIIYACINLAVTRYITPTSVDENLFSTNAWKASLHVAEMENICTLSTINSDLSFTSACSSNCLHKIHGSLAEDDDPLSDAKETTEHDSSNESNNTTYDLSAASPDQQLNVLEIYSENTEENDPEVRTEDPQEILGELTQQVAAESSHVPPLRRIDARSNPEYLEGQLREKIISKLVSQFGFIEQTAIKFIINQFTYETLKQKSMTDIEIYVTDHFMSRLNMLVPHKYDYHAKDSDCLRLKGFQETIEKLIESTNKVIRLKEQDPIVISAIHEQIKELTTAFTSSSSLADQKHLNANEVINKPTAITFASTAPVREITINNQTTVSKSAVESKKKYPTNCFNYLG